MICLHSRASFHVASKRLYIFIGVLIVFAIALHVRFSWAIPDPIFTPDSAAYLHPVFSLMSGGAWDMPFHRTMGYPAFLFVLLRTFSHFLIVLIIQHALWLAMAAITALIYYRHFHAKLLHASIVFFLVAILPRGVVYSHTILTEVLFTFVAILAVERFLSATRHPALDRWITAGTLLGIAVLIRPTGRAWVAGLFFCLLIYLKGRRPYLRGGFACLTTFLLTLTPVCLYHYHTHGFFGTEKTAGAYLFINAAQFLNIANVKDKSVKSILDPFYSTPEDLARLRETRWVYADPAGPMNTLTGALPRGTDVDQVFLTLSLQAMTDHPLRFILQQARLFFKFQRTSSQRPAYLFPKEVPFFRGMEIFGNATRAFPEARRFVFFQPAFARPYEARMLRHPSYPHQPGPFPLNFVWPYVWAVGALPSLAVLLSLFLWKDRNLRFPMVMLWSVIVAHILITNLATGPDIQIRYGIPIEPLYLVLAMAGVTQACQSIHWKERLLRLRGKAVQCLQA